MNRALRFPYTAAGKIAQALARIVPAGSSKFQRGLVARRDIVARYRVWGVSSRDVAHPLVWFHAPSVGEGLQALPVIELLRARNPDLQIAYTFFSPSAEEFARGVRADFADFLPFDTFDDAESIVEALKPTALVFSKLDVWPALTEAATRAGVKVGIVSATLPDSSGRRGFLARQILGDAYRSLSAVGAIDEEDAERLREQGVPAERTVVSGDTRYDQVWARAQKAPSALVERLRSPRPTLVAGSTWPSDEEHLLPAWKKVREKIPDARLIIAPHELSDAHLKSIERWALASSVVLAQVDSANAPHADVILVNRYGLLGDLYALADAAFVGGGFHSAGLHSVLEPAAFGAPVLFGPGITKSRDAQKLAAVRGGAIVKGSPDLVLRLRDWLGSSAARDAAGDKAREMVEAGVGAAERSYALVVGLLDGS